MSDIQKQIESLQEQATELSELREDVLNVKSNITITAVGLLLEKLDDSINDMVAIASEKEYYDKNLAVTLKETITEAINAFSKLQPPTVTVTSPNISFDTKPIVSIAAEIGRQNVAIMALMQKLDDANGNGQTQELQRLITAMVGKNNAFIEKGFQVINYSKEFSEIATAINGRATEWEAKVTRRNQAGQLEQLIITSK